MRANGRRAGEWPDDEYHKRKASANAARKPANDATARKSGENDTTCQKIGDGHSEALKMDFGDEWPLGENQDQHAELPRLVMGAR